MKKYDAICRLFCLTTSIIILFGCGDNGSSQYLKSSREGMEALIVNAFVKEDKEYFASHLYSGFKSDADILSSHVEAYENFLKNNGNLKNYEISAGEIFNAEINSELIPMASYLVEGKFKNSKIIFGVTLIYEKNEWLFYGFSQK